MSEAHVNYTATDTVQKVMWAIFQFIDNGGSGRSGAGVRWADNDITHAVNNASGFAANRAAVTGTGASYFAHNSYMVIESASQMPSGRRWQVKIQYVVNSYDHYLKYDFAPRGGWAYGSENFGAYPVTGLIQWNDSNNPPGGASTMVSCSNLDTYGSSSTPYEYFRVIIRLNGYADNSQFVRNSLRVGGYIPTDAVNDTNPACALAGKPGCNNEGNAWGRVGVSSNLNCIPPDTDGSATDLGLANASGYVTSTGTSATAPGGDTTVTDKTRAGQWVNFPAFLVSYNATATVGYFGKHDMFGINGPHRSDGTADANNEYMVVNNILIRWKP